MSKSCGLATELGDGGRLLIVGMGRSGLAAAAAAKRLMPGIHVVVSDSSAAALNVDDESFLRKLDVEIASGRADDSLLDRCGLVIKSPGVPVEIPLLDEARRRGIPVWGEVEFAWRFIPNLFVGVTGTNGKTTTTELIGHILRHAGRPCRVAGNVGTALSSFVGEVSGDEIMVVELSSFQLEDSINFRPDIAVLLNLTEDHMDRHHDVESYYSAKERIFANQNKSDTALVNFDDPLCRRALTGQAIKVWFSRAVSGAENGTGAQCSPPGGTEAVDTAGDKAPLVFVENETIYADRETLQRIGSALKPGLARPWRLKEEADAEYPEAPDSLAGLGRNEKANGEVSEKPKKSQAAPVFKWHDASLKGLHNLENSLAATAVSLILGLMPEEVAAGIKSFPGVRHRLQEVRIKDGVRYVNDSKATNVDAAVRALSAFEGGIHLILGGSSKGCSFDDLASAASKAKVRQVIAIGQSAPDIVHSFKLLGQPVMELGGLEEAVKTAAEMAVSGDVVLLAPACASFDQYRNFEERGEHFIHLVKEL